MKKVVVSLILMASFAAQAGVLRLTAPGSVGASDDTVFVSGSYNYIIATLPACSASNDGEKHTVKGLSSLAHCTQVAAQSGETVNNASADTVCAYQADQLVCDGTNHDWVSVGYW